MVIIYKIHISFQEIAWFTFTICLFNFTYSYVQRIFFSAPGNPGNIVHPVTCNCSFCTHISLFHDFVSQYQLILVISSDRNELISRSFWFYFFTDKTCLNTNRSCLYNKCVSAVIFPFFYSKFWLKFTKMIHFKSLSLETINKIKKKAIFI